MKKIWAAAGVAATTAGVTDSVIGTPHGWGLLAVAMGIAITGAALWPTPPTHTPPAPAAAGDKPTPQDPPPPAPETWGTWENWEAHWADCPICQRREQERKQRDAA